MVEINFLCVHKKLRSKRLAPVLIKEITRRVHLKGIWQAIYTAGIEVTKPFCKNLYYHRQLNPRKLVEIQFAYKNPKLKMELFEKLHRLPAKTSISLEPLKEEDSESAMKLLNDYLQKFKMRFYFSEKEFSHFFVPRENVVSTYVKK
ncbi:glycylpeptide N-tetradecanoyltransferase, partial [Bonamia ostreae]